jgi:carbonic anhydrase
MKKLALTAAWTVTLAWAFASLPSLAASPPDKFCAVQSAKTCQDKVTPAMVQQRFEKGNQRFVSGKRQIQKHQKHIAATAAAQYPLASVLSCIDSRAPAEFVFDQGIGDLFNARVAGNALNEDILGSLEFAHKVAGAKLLVVMGHTSCGAIKGACDDIQLGNLTGLLGKIKPAVALVSADIKDRSSKNYAFVEMVAENHVKLTVAAIRERSPILREMEQKGEIKIVGAMYDVKTGKVRFYEEAPVSKPAQKS